MSFQRKPDIQWADLRNQTILVQEWEGSHATREFYASLIGIGLAFRSHSASEQSVFALIAAGFGVTLATESQTQVHVPGLIYRPIAEDKCAGGGETRLDTGFGRAGGWTVYQLHAGSIPDRGRRLSLPAFRKNTIGCHEPCHHRRDQFRRIWRRLIQLLAERVRIGDEVTMNPGGQFDSQLHRPVVFKNAKFELLHFLLHQPE